jgi:thiamine biosynthesis protein ThiS
MIKVNGQDKPIDEGTTLAQLIQQHKLTPQKVAVELNRRLVRTEKYNETVLKAGDEVEIVTFVGGG